MIDLMNWYERKLAALFEHSDISLSPQKTARRFLAYSIGFGLAAALFFLRESQFLAITAFFATFALVHIVVFVMLSLIAAERGRIAEELLPDFLTLLAANLRSGLTLDKALVLSARKEFGPLATEIDKAAKRSVTGAPFDEVLQDMSLKIESESFRKTINLVVQGVRAGGDLAALLEKTASDIRKFSTVRKEVRSHVMLYELFVFFATAIGAPLLYAVSTFLTETISRIKSGTEIATPVSTTSQFANLAQGTFSVSPDTLFWFSIAAVVITTLFGSMAIGVIGAGKRTEGLKYFPIMLLIGLSLLFLARLALQSIIAPLFG
ncbi:MAG: type II secretion system F family protein [Candidatus Micrarchaeota archaeon]